MHLITGLLGLALLSGPFIFAYFHHFAVKWTIILLGIGILTLSSFASMENDTNHWRYWLGLIPGYFVMLAPFLFGFEDHLLVTLIMFLFGILIIIFVRTRLYNFFLRLKNNIIN